LELREIWLEEDGGRSEEQQILRCGMTSKAAKATADSLRE
jgi:hypothetical protein